MLAALRIFRSPSFSPREENPEPEDRRIEDVDDTKRLPPSEKDSEGEKEPISIEVSADIEDDELNPGELSFEEDTAGGMGRHLGIFSCTMIVVGTTIGTGIFATPSSILSSVGSVGASLMLWLLGFVLSVCGLFIWLELGTMFPRSGGEKVYLEAVYQKPKHLATFFFATNAIVLSSSSSGCIMSSSILITAGHSVDLWTTRGIAIAAIVFTILLHGLVPRVGVWLMNVLGMFKIIILLFIVVSGWVVLSGRTRVKDPYANFRDAFAGSSSSRNNYATATLKVLYTYSGWSTLNYVLNDVKNPVRTLKIAAPLGFSICAVLYVMANISYFAASTKEEIVESGVTVASLFFNNVFGPKAQKALTLFVALSGLGNVVTATYSTSRTIQELAKEGIPLLFGNRFWASNWPTHKSPFPALVLHMLISAIVIIAPPLAVAYPFVLDVETYPGIIVSLLVVVGLFWLRWRKPHLPRPIKVWWPLAVFFLASTVFLLVMPFLPPENGVGDTPPFPITCKYCLVSIGVLAGGVLYWAIWHVVPRWFGYEYVLRKETLSDGTVVMVVCQGSALFTDESLIIRFAQYTRTSLQ
ncbi:high affinity methionine permease [Cubamyces menziesii]|nr:high affinity methionine permease [Cubamyces menziesii]